MDNTPSKPKASYPPKKVYTYKMKQMESAKSPPQQETPEKTTSQGGLYGKNGKNEAASEVDNQGSYSKDGRVWPTPRGGRGEKKLSLLRPYIHDSDQFNNPDPAEHGAREQDESNKVEEHRIEVATTDPNPYDYEQEIALEQRRTGESNKRSGASYSRETVTKKSCDVSHPHGKDMRALMATQSFYLDKPDFEIAKRNFEGDYDSKNPQSTDHQPTGRRRKSDQTESHGKDYTSSSSIHPSHQHLNPQHPRSKSQSGSGSQFLHSGSGRPRGRPKKDQSERRVNRQPSLSGMCDEITSSIDNVGRRGSRPSASTSVCDSQCKTTIKVEADSEGPHASSSSSASSNMAKLSEHQICQVCGDIAAGFHCGAYVCEACKKFFVRCLKQDVGEKFMCSRSKMCTVNKETRTQCQYCRYQKCLSLGMYKPGSGPGGGRFGAEISHIPCKVCESPSSGYHFGAITCEGCKGFFRRTVKERAGVRYVCSRNGSCNITVNTRNVCKFCRYQKCLQAGMTPDGSRIGRQPNAVKHATMLELQRLSTHSLVEVKKEVQSPTVKTNLLSPGSNQDLSLPENAQFEMIDPSNFPEDLYVTQTEESKMKAQVERLSQAGGDISEAYLQTSDPEGGHQFQDQTQALEHHAADRPVDIQQFNDSYFTESQSAQHATHQHTDHLPRQSKEAEGKHMAKELQDREHMELCRPTRVAEREHPKLTQTFKQQQQELQQQQQQRQQEQQQQEEQQRQQCQQRQSHLVYDVPVTSMGQMLPPNSSHLTYSCAEQMTNELQALHYHQMQQARIDVLNAQHRELRRQEQVKAMELRMVQNKLEHHTEVIRKLSSPKGQHTEQYSNYSQHQLQLQQQQELQLQQLQQQQQLQLQQQQQLQLQQQSTKNNPLNLRQNPSEGKGMNELNTHRRPSHTEYSMPEDRLKPSRPPSSRESEFPVESNPSVSRDIGHGMYKEVSAAASTPEKQVVHEPMNTRPKQIEHYTRTSTGSSNPSSLSPPLTNSSEMSSESPTDLSMSNRPREEKTPKNKSYLETVANFPSHMRTLTEKVTQASLYLRPVLQKSEGCSKVQRGTTVLTMWETMMAQFGQCAPSVIRFARRIPGFQKFPVNVQISKVQMSMYPIVLTVLSTQFNMETKRYNYFHMDEEERDIVFENFCGFRILHEHFLRIGHSVKYKDLDDIEIAFLCAIVLMTGYAPGEEESSLLPEAEADLVASLEYYCAEKYKEDNGRDAYILARVAELNRCNVEHQKAVCQVKAQHEELEFPQLYAETYLSM